MSTDAKLRLGGMALRNGLLVHGPTHWAAAVRAGDGTIKVASGRKPRLRAADKIPGVRGVFRLGEAFAVIPLVKRGLPEARMPFQDVSVLGVAAAATITGSMLKKRVRGNLGEAGAAVIWRRRCSPCAAASSPSTTASSTRRSPPTSRTPTTPAMRPRSTSAAAHISSRR
jgi:hypothetical protein